MATEQAVESKPKTEEEPKGDVNPDANTNIPSDNVTDEVESKDSSNDKQIIDEQSKDDVKEEKYDDNDTSNVNTEEESKIDFDAIDKVLFAESPSTNTNTLSFDAIKFASDEERNGAMELQSKLRSDHKLNNLPPFEMARFYIGSKCRIPKATQKWIDTMGLYKTHNLKDVTEESMIKCFRESM